MLRSTWWVMVAAAVTAAVTAAALPGCSSAPDREATVRSDSTIGESATSSDVSTPSTVTEPTGVAGLDDPNPFCAAWAVYSGTLQSVGIAGAFGELDSGQLATLEVVAAPALVHAVRDIEGSWPGEIAGERDVVLDRVVGPFARRAGKAVAELGAAGATEAEVAQLRVVWLGALAVRDPAEPVIALPALAPEVAQRVALAAAAFDGAITPFALDPSLIVDSVESPRTDMYLSTQCPDLATIGVGDAV